MIILKSSDLTTKTSLFREYVLDQTPNRPLFFGPWLRDTYDCKVEKGHSSKEHFCVTFKSPNHELLFKIKHPDCEIV